MNPIGAVVTDLDRTFSDTRLRPVPSAIQTMQQVRKMGIRTILATGRTFPELKRKAAILPAFDFLIAEGGGLVGTPHAVRPLIGGTRTVQEFHLWLNERGILHERGIASLSIARADHDTVKEYPGLQRFQVTPNLNRLDVTLKGVDKGAAIRHLRKRPPMRGRRILGFGDGENDVALFRAIDVRVAVSNAVPALHRLAHDTTRFPGGRGVADYLRRHVLAQHPVIKGRPRLRPAWKTSSSSKT